MRLPEAKLARTTWESASMTANKAWRNRAKITPAEITGPWSRHYASTKLLVRGLLGQAVGS